MMAVKDGRICTACGQEVPPEEESCPNCGTWAGVSEREPETGASSEVQESIDSPSSDKAPPEAQEPLELLPPEPDEVLSLETSSPVITCPHCTQTHPPEARFCPFTGQRMPELAACPQCGKSVQLGWAACAYCGNPLGWDRAKSRISIWQRIWIYTIVGVALTAVLGVFFISSLVDQLSTLHEKPLDFGAESPISTAKPSQTEMLLPTFTPDASLALSPNLDQRTTEIVTTQTTQVETTSTNTPTPDSIVSLAHDVFEFIQDQEATFEDNFDVDRGWNFNTDTAQLFNKQLIVTATHRTSGSSDPWDKWQGAEIKPFTSNAIAISVDLRFVDNQGLGHCNVELWEEEREDERRKRYLFVFDSFGRAHMERSFGDSFHELNRKDQIIVDPQEFYTITIIVLDQYSAVFVNGELAYTVIDFSDPKNFTRQILAANANAVCAFDNFKTWDLANYYQEYLVRGPEQTSPTMIVQTITSTPEPFIISSHNLDQLEVTTIWESGSSINADNLEWSPDGNYLAFTLEEFGARIVNINTGNITHNLFGYDYSENIYQLAWSPNGKIIASIGDDQTLRVWNSRSAQLIWAFGSESYFCSNITWSPKGDLVATIDGTMVKIWDVDTGDEQLQFEHTALMFFLSWSPDGTKIAAADSRDVIVWDIATREKLVTLEIPETRIIKWSQDSSEIWIAGYKWIQSLDTTTWKGHFNLSVPVILNTDVSARPSIYWSLDGSLIVSLIQNDAEQPARIIEIPTGNTIQNLGQEVLLDGAWSPDGTLFAASDNDGSIKVWGVPKRIEQLPPLPSPTATPDELLFFEDFEGGTVNWTEEDIDGDYRIASDETGNLIYEVDNAKSDWSNIWIGYYYWEDYAVEYRFKIIQANQNSYIGTILRSSMLPKISTDIQELYHVQYNTYENNITVAWERWALPEGQHIPLRSSPHYLSYGSWNIIRVEIVGLNLEVFVNGEFAFEVTESILNIGATVRRSGIAGIQIGPETTVWIDDIRVESLEGD